MPDLYMNVRYQDQIPRWVVVFIVTTMAVYSSGVVKSAFMLNDNVLISALNTVNIDVIIVIVIIMVALCNRADHYIFILFLSSFFFFFSSFNLSGRRLDVYHTLAHGVALVRI